jgi:hypothetical protein
MRRFPHHCAAMQNKYHYPIILPFVCAQSAECDYIRWNFLIGQGHRPFTQILYFFLLLEAEPILNLRR